MSVLSASQHSIQHMPKNDEPIASYLAELNKRSKRSTFDGSYNTTQKRRRSSGVIDKIMRKLGYRCCERASTLITHLSLHRHALVQAKEDAFQPKYDGYFMAI